MLNYKKAAAIWVARAEEKTLENFVEKTSLESKTVVSLDLSENLKLDHKVHKVHKIYIDRLSNHKKDLEILLILKALYEAKDNSKTHELYESYDNLTARGARTIQESEEKEKSRQYWQFRERVQSDQFVKKAQWDWGIDFPFLMKYSLKYNFTMVRSCLMEVASRHPSSLRPDRDISEQYKALAISKIIKKAKEFDEKIAANQLYYESYGRKD